MVLDLASNQGKIRLALRSRNNLETAQTQGVKTSQLLNVADSKVAQASIAAAPKAEVAVEVIKGMDRSKASM